MLNFLFAGRVVSGVFCRCFSSAHLASSPGFYEINFTLSTAVPVLLSRWHLVFYLCCLEPLSALNDWTSVFTCLTKKWIISSNKSISSQTRFYFMQYNLVSFIKKILLRINLYTIPLVWGRPISSSFFIPLNGFFLAVIINASRITVL